MDIHGNFSLIHVLQKYMEFLKYPIINRGQRTSVINLFANEEQVAKFPQISICTVVLYILYSLPAITCNFLLNSLPEDP